MRGFYGIGIWQPIKGVNVGTIWRSAQAFGASFIFTVGTKYKRQSSDTTHATRHIPLYQYEDTDDMIAHLPYDCPLIAIEFLPDATWLPSFSHLPRCAYILGGENKTLGHQVLDRCVATLYIPTAYCLNVAVAGSIVMYDRIAKGIDNKREKM